MKILLIGYGKMGKAIERLALERGHEIVGKIDVDNMEDLSHIDPVTVDVAIEFTSPASAFENIKACIEKGIKVISGSTGWLERMAEIHQMCKSNNGTFLYASNYSLGVNLFFALNKKLAQMMAPYRDYNPQMEEVHHTQKLDSPSGTAITLAEGLISEHDGKSKWVNAPQKNKRELSIISLREDEVPGTHTVTYKSAVDEIEIKHTAHTRDSFALGAVLVAEWIKDKEGIQTIESFLAVS